MATREELQKQIATSEKMLKSNATNPRARPGLKRKLERLRKDLKTAKPQDNDAQARKFLRMNPRGRTGQAGKNKMEKLGITKADVDKVRPNYVRNNSIPDDKKPVVKKSVDKKVKKTKSTDPNRGNKVPGIHSSEYLTTTPRPKMGQVNKTGAESRGGGADRPKKDTGSTMQKLFGPSKEKVEMGKDQMKRARASMGMKDGGKVKLWGSSQKNAAAAAKKMAEGRARAKANKGKTPAPLPSSRPVDKAMERTRKPNMKKGGRVKGKCKVDGIAIRGRTRAMHK